MHEFWDILSCQHCEHCLKYFVFPNSCLSKYYQWLTCHWNQNGKRTIYVHFLPQEDHQVRNSCNKNKGDDEKLKQINLIWQFMMSKRLAFKEKFGYHRNVVWLFCKINDKSNVFFKSVEFLLFNCGLEQNTTWKHNGAIQFPLFFIWSHNWSWQIKKVREATWFPTCTN